VNKAVAQDSAPSATRRQRGRPFPKGVSGNPAGRPRGLVKAIRESTRDGEELVAFMVKVLRGRVVGVRVRDQIDAATWLADRGFGKPLPAPEPGVDVASLLAALHGRHPTDPNKVYDAE